jgi:hypothetical protein
MTQVSKASDVIAVNCYSTTRQLQRRQEPKDNSFYSADDDNGRCGNQQIHVICACEVLTRHEIFALDHNIMSTQQIPVLNSARDTILL